MYKLEYKYHYFILHNLKVERDENDQQTAENILGLESQKSTTEQYELLLRANSTTDLVDGAEEPRNTEDVENMDLAAMAAAAGDRVEEAAAAAAAATTAGSEDDEGWSDDDDDDDDDANVKIVISDIKPSWPSSTATTVGSGLPIVGGQKSQQLQIKNAAGVLVSGQQSATNLLNAGVIVGAGGAIKMPAQPGAMLAKGHY